MSELDIAGNRRASKWPASELVRRVLWAAARPLFRWSPRICWPWRSVLLRCLGARLGPHVRLEPSAVIFAPWRLDVGAWSSIGAGAVVYNLGHVRIGERCTVSQRAHLCGGSHDHRSPSFDLVKAPVMVDNDAWVAAEAFVGPGVTVGAGAVIGARAVVVKNVEPWTIVVGNPARVIGRREIGTTRSA